MKGSLEPMEERDHGSSPTWPTAPGAPLAAAPRPRSWPLAWRLLLPLAILALAFGCLVTIFLIRGVSARMDQETDARLSDLADTIAGSGYALDTEILAKVKAVSGVEVLTLAPDGTIGPSTLSGARAHELADRVRAGSAGPYIVLDGSRYRILTRPVRTGAGGPEFRMTVAASTRATDGLKRGLARTIVLATATGLLAFLLVGQLAVRSATRPLALLAEAAREVGRGATDHPIRGGGGQEIEILAAGFRSMVRDLADSRAELVRAERLAVAGKMAAGVAHEVRNPLSSIRMTVQLLLSREREDRLVSAELREILEEVDRLDLVIGNLLDLSAPPRFEPTRQNLNALVEGTLRLTARKLEHLKVRVIADLAPDLPAAALDTNKTRQAFLNVLLNALEAMPRGGELRIVSRRVADSIEVAFEDTGTGLTAEAASRAFEPFFSTRASGAGLGLHVVRSLMNLHGGRVRLEPATGGGTRCVLEFPLLARPPVATPAARIA